MALTLDELAYGQVSGRFLVLGVDDSSAGGADADDLPDATPVSGSVSCKPNRTALDTQAATVLQQQYTFDLQDGYVRSKAGGPAMMPAASAGDPWTYTLTFKFANAPSPDPVSFTMLPGDNVDLRTLIPVDPSTGEPTYLVPRLSGLADVDAPAPAAGDALVYDGTVGVWKPGTVATQAALDAKQDAATLDADTAANIADDTTQTAAALSDAYVAGTALVPLPGAQVAYWKDSATASQDATVTITLGATPLQWSTILFRGSVLLIENLDYHLDGNVLTLDVTTGDVLIAQYAYDAAETPAPWVVGYPQPVTDSFDRADDAASLGTADTGQAWTAAAGTWGISGNQAYLATPSGGVNDVAYLDAGFSDYTAQVKIATQGSGGASLAVNVIDADNCVDANATALYRRTAGTNYTLVTFSEAFASGDTMRITKAGSTLTVFRQAGSAGAFTNVGTVDEPQGADSTFVGLRYRTTADARFDDFSVTP